MVVAPTYAWQMPKVVERWIRETEFEGTKDIYIVLTCGGSVGNAAAYAKKLCAEKGLHFSGLALVAMPNNYVALSNTPDKAECAAILEKAGERIVSLAALIQKGEPFPEAAISFKDRMNSGPVNGLFYALFVHDKGFAASEACVSCGKCAQRCPLNNIRISDGKPVWNGNCTHCMACIGGCPTEAIEYKSASKGNRRYYIMKD
ncbi:EFR1 family ferrodoxin [uncultured Anaerotruncus sp.]|uniref:EFR1 family ferrodoxin n=1 Tax=uncultured Anaerotruncus sp. TaxID=905011 RepID=UPI0034A0BC1F